ncbi:MAG: Trm112 family protein [Candidatus Eisenbacteria bacterium]|nr:Trm112 family protein [Candidatus Eisenbacteria bacterium]
MLAKELLDILACPKCKGALEYDTGRQRLHCHACRLSYPIQDDIPIMLIDEAEPFDSGTAGAAGDA